MTLFFLILSTFQMKNECNADVKGSKPQARVPPDREALALLRMKYEIFEVKNKHCEWRCARFVITMKHL